MNISKVDYNVERKILIGLIISDEFTREILPELKLEYFQNKAAREIAKWCKGYYEKYGKVPRRDIQQIYEDRKAKLDEDVEKYLSSLLQSLSEEYDYDMAQSFNAKFYIDRAIQYFKKRKLQFLAEQIELALENDQIDAAEAVVHKYSTIERSTEDSIDPFASETLVQECFESVGEALFKVPSPLGDILNPQLYRASFIAFQGPEKSGKTWLLQELAIRAVRSRRRVVLFEAGDLTKEQRLCRLYARLAGKPWIPGKQEGVIKLTVPEIPDDELFEDFVLKEEEFPVLTVYDALKVREKYGKLWKGRLRISVHTNSTLTVRKIDSLLTKWEQQEGWIPDVVIIDYADIMTTDSKYSDTRTQTNEIWKGLRALSQKWNVCLITATQADAQSYEKGTQTLANFSEDKRKYSHVTAIFALNRTPGERQSHIFRVAPLLIREGVVSVSHKQVAIFTHPGKVQTFWKMFYTTKPLA